MSPRPDSSASGVFKRARGRSLKTAHALGVEGIAKWIVNMPSKQTAERMTEVIFAAGKWLEYT